jgi:hypothetical protein
LSGSIATNDWGRSLAYPAQEKIPQKKQKLTTRSGNAIDSMGLNLRENLEAGVLRPQASL